MSIGWQVDEEAQYARLEMLVESKFDPYQPLSLDAKLTCWLHELKACCPTALE